MVKVSLQTELQILDPIITTISATRVFAYLVFDELVGIDTAGNYHPQMLEKWDISPDRLTYTFRLRDGLKFSDGTPVLAADCTASIQRWAKREAMGVQMMDAAESLTAIDDTTFVLKLKRPFAFVIEALGKPSYQVPVIMPARLARLDPNTVVPEVVGSGPFLFLQKEWQPGAIASFVKNPNYVPRGEPADGLSGGKVVNIDRVDLISMSDQATRVAALKRGELDMLEVVPFDSIAMLKRDNNVKIGTQSGIGQVMAVLNLNHAQPPFNNLKVRQAAQLAVLQPDVMAGLGLPPEMYEACYSIYMCSASGTTAAGTQFSTHVGTAEAKKLLSESGYKGEPVVLLHAETSAVLNPVGLVIADELKQAGFNVDVKTSDYATVAARRLSKAPVENGGWSATPQLMTGVDLVNPLASQLVSFNCVEFPGSYCDPAMTPLLRAYAEASDPSEQAKLRDQIQVKFHDNVDWVLAGQFSAPPAYRADLTGVVPFGFPVFWNMRRQ